MNRRKKKGPGEAPRADLGDGHATTRNVVTKKMARPTAARKPELRAITGGKGKKDKVEPIAVPFLLGTEVEMGQRLIFTATGGLPESAPSPVFDEGDLHTYGDGMWHAREHAELSRIIQSFDGALVTAGAKKKPLKIGHRNVVGAILLAYDQVKAKGFFLDAPAAVVFADTTLMVEGDKIVRHPHSPDYRARACYPFKHTPKAKAPRFQRMMEQHFEGDTDAKDKIACLQQFFGACLFGIATRYEKCLALPCDGGGGRSTTLKIIATAMPAGTVAYVAAKDLRSKERRAKLPGKRLNFSDEVPPDAFLEAEDFKLVVTGNVVSAEEKYKSSFDFRPIAGHVFPIQISAAAEQSDAFRRRFIIVRYNHNFEKAKTRVYDLAKQILDEELEGVVAWMIEGAERLLRQGKYTIPASHHAEEREWRMATDSVSQFLDEEYTPALFKEPRNQAYDASGKPTGKPSEPHDWTSGRALHGHYLRWCDNHGHKKPVLHIEFGRRVKALYKAPYDGPKPETTRLGVYYPLRPLAPFRKLIEEAEKKGTKVPKACEGVMGAVQALSHGGKQGKTSKKHPP